MVLPPWHGTMDDVSAVQWAELDLPAAKTQRCNVFFQTAYVHLHSTLPFLFDVMSTPHKRKMQSGYARLLHMLDRD